MAKNLYKFMFFVTIGFIFVTSAMSRNGNDDLGHLAGPIAIIMVAVLFIVGAIYSARKSGVMYSRTTSSAGLFGLFRTKRSATRVVTRNENPFEYWIWLGGGIVFCTAMIALGLWLLTKHTAN
jgi:hypothetical protein